MIGRSDPSGIRSKEDRMQRDNKTTLSGSLHSMVTFWSPANAAALRCTAHHQGTGPILSSLHQCVVSSKTQGISFYSRRRSSPLRWLHRVRYLVFHQLWPSVEDHGQAVVNAPPHHLVIVAPIVLTKVTLNSTKHFLNNILTLISPKE